MVPAASQPRDVHSAVVGRHDAPHLVLCLCASFLANKDVISLINAAASLKHATLEEQEVRHCLLALYNIDDVRLHRLVLTTGSSMVDQFQPWYFGVAFAFCFKFCVGMPDMPAFAKRPRHRRAEDAPRIEAPLWVKVTSRRVEAQLRRDWCLGFAQGNYLFRSALNLSRTVYSYETCLRPEGGRGFSAEELKEGAISICKALAGK